MSHAARAAKSTVDAKGKTSSPSADGLRINEPNDAFEQEAERVADEVMKGGRSGLEWSYPQIGDGHFVQRKCSCGSGSGEEQCEECKNKEAALQRKSNGAAGPSVAPPIVNEVLGSRGKALDPATRAFMEPRLSHDFSQVRIHSDTKAAESARAVNALAYTVGNHIVFGEGSFDPAEKAGRHLLAHELVHVTQQQTGKHSLVQRQQGGPVQVGPPEPDECEGRADITKEFNDFLKALPALLQSAPDFTPEQKASFKGEVDRFLQTEGGVNVKTFKVISCDKINTDLLIQGETAGAEVDADKKEIRLSKNTAKLMDDFKQTKNKAFLASLIETLAHEKRHATLGRALKVDPKDVRPGRPETVATKAEYRAQEILAVAEEIAVGRMAYGKPFAVSQAKQEKLRRQNNMIRNYVTEAEYKRLRSIIISKLRERYGFEHHCDNALTLGVVSSMDHNRWFECVTGAPGGIVPPVPDDLHICEGFCDTQSKGTRQTENEEDVPVQRKCAGLEKEEEVHRNEVVPPIVHEVLRSPGHSLDPKTRYFMESRFGQDFSQVRVHADSKAAESARAVNANAYTVGSDVVFGGGCFMPESAAGKQLIAHELTHVLQQTRRNAFSTSSPGQIDPDAQLESEAERVGKDIRENFKNEAKTPPRGALQRQPTKTSKSATPAHIKEIVVDQNIKQRVTATFTDGTTIDGQCSTGKGHCCFDDSAGSTAGGACSASESNLVGTNCTPVGSFTVTAKVPLTNPNVPPFWTQFHDPKNVALHQYSPVDGTPLSHGCVRLDKDFAKQIYEGSRVGVTRVVVKNLAKPVCGNSNLQDEWKGDFESAGRPLDGESIRARLGPSTKEEIERERRHIREARKDLKSAFRTDEAGLDAELASLSGGASIASKIPRCGQPAKPGKGQGRLQRAAIGPQPQTVPPIVPEVLRSPGQPLDAEIRTFMERRFKHDFSHVRVHTDAEAAESARAVNARAYTVGRDIVFGSGALAPERADGRELLAHELVHTLQQNSRRSGLTADLKVNQPDDGFEQEARRVARNVVSPQSRVSVPLGGRVSQPAVQRDIPPIDDPTRYKKVHEALFVPPATTAPSGTRPPFDAAAQAFVKKQFTDAIKDLQAKNPSAFYPDIEVKTTKSDADASAVAIDKQIRAFYPQIAAPLPPAAFLSHIHIMTDADTSADSYLRQWLAESLQKTDLEKYEVKEKDQVFQDFLTDLLKDSYLGDRIRELARHKGAFTEESTQDVYLNRGLSADQREPTLVHELVHAYTHPSFGEWVDSTLDKRLYSEGFTEYLARKAMTADQLKNNGGQYQNRVDRINNEVARFVSDDDIARAYFAGEVWLLEGKSQVAKKTLKEQTGIDTEAKGAEEREQSHTTDGIVETVAPGERYRFMNLGNEDFNPKREHLAAFTQIYQKFIQNDPAARIRFVGHASSPGTVAFNNELSLKRAKAFYQMARDAGVPESQLLDAKSPAHFGKSQPTAVNEDVLGRSFNRRVELFIIHAASPTNTGTQTTPSTPANPEKSLE